MRKITIIAIVFFMMISGILGLHGCDTSTSTEPEIPAGCEGPAGPTTFEVTPLENGGTLITATGNITQAVEYFQSLIADRNPRNIHWDDIPAELTNVDDFPGWYFNKTSAGSMYSNGEIGFSPLDGTALRVSDNNFSDLNPTYNTQFLPFSSPKTFTPISNNELGVNFIFEGAGSPYFYSVRALGVVFADVDVAGSTFLQIYQHSRVWVDLGVFNVPAGGDSCSLSFIGFVFDEPSITSITITAGQATLGSDVNDISNGGSSDLVIMDNFIYAY